MKKKQVVGALAVGALSAVVAVGAFRHPLALTWDIWQAGHATPDAIAARQRKRLDALIAFARARSPYYRTLYRALPAATCDLNALPVVTKPDLMAHFDEWVTDPAVTLRGVEAFVADTTLLGTNYLGRYAVWTTSGTTGKPGVFLHDRWSMLVDNILIPLRSYRWLTLTSHWYILLRARIAVLVATEGHFAIADWFERDRRLPTLRKRIQLFSALKPLGELVRGLNAFRPDLLIGYPSLLKLLAQEQRAGRLRIAPMYVGTGGEWMEPDTRARIEEAFRCTVRDNYGASECLYIAVECAQGWLHVNADWVILEPVDADYQPTPPGQRSHTVLLTNLANRVQPLIRYDLGDSVTVRPDPCPCGFPLPAIHVEGRQGDVLHMATPSGEMVAILPLAVGAVIEETPGVQRTQVIQTARDTLTLRLQVTDGATSPSAVWDQVEQRLRAFLTAQGLPAVTIVRASEPPQQSPTSGKFREVWSALPDGDAVMRDEAR